MVVGLRVVVEVDVPLVIELKREVAPQVPATRPNAIGTRRALTVVMVLLRE